MQVTATFEGRRVDLSRGWGEANACAVLGPAVVECFRTATAMDARMGGLDPKSASAQSASAQSASAQSASAQSASAQSASAQSASATASATASASCSSPLRLYDYTYYGGRQLAFWSRGYWQNLADYGFDNQTSSYFVGGCTSYLADYAYGGGAWHPGAGNPGAGVPWMSYGWDNRVSSIYVT
jgi:hypothetical protein